MRKIALPNKTDLIIENIVFDYNGTLAVDGLPLPGVRKRLLELTDSLNVYILTSDTHGIVRAQLEGLPLTIRIMSSRDHLREKEDFIHQLGSLKTIAVGNGNNDAGMLRAAAVGIAVLGREGLAVKAVDRADLIFSDITHLFETLASPARLTASLRA